MHIGTCFCFARPKILTPCEAELEAFSNVLNVCTSSQLHSFLTRFSRLATKQESNRSLCWVTQFRTCQYHTVCFVSYTCRFGNLLSVPVPRTNCDRKHARLVKQFAHSLATRLTFCWCVFSTNAHHRSTFSNFMAFTLQIVLHAATWGWMLATSHANPLKITESQSQFWNQSIAFRRCVRRLSEQA